MKNKPYIALFFIVVLILSIVLLELEKRYFFRGAVQRQSNEDNSQGVGADQSAIIKDKDSAVMQQTMRSPMLTTDPIPDALSRITKKPFGIYVTPETSPVQPERFHGYHTGSDLEIIADEENTEVSVVALCDGKLLVKRSASGYGGVAVQACVLDGRDVTVVYGHMRLASIVSEIGNEIKAGEFLGYLGKGFSSQTDGERKHLHLGIYEGTDINILGYVQTKSALSGWLDPEKYLD